MAKKKGKAPAFQFYVKDWLSDPQLRQTTPATRGIWIDCLCFMWQNNRSGQISGTRLSLSRMLGISEATFEDFLTEIKCIKIADVTFCPPNVTLTNRRMSNDYNTRDASRLRKQRQRSHTQCHENVTPPSSSASSTASSSASSKTQTGGAREGTNWEIQAVFDGWQTACLDHGKMVSHETLTGDIRAAIAKALSEHDDLAKIIKAFENYATVLQGDEYYWTHAWPLDKFLERGLSQFLDGAKPLENFLITNRGSRDGNAGKDIGRSFAGAEDDAAKFEGR